MDEKRKYNTPDEDINHENEHYDPYEEYVRNKISQEQKEEYGDSYRRYTNPDMGPEDDRGRSYRPRRRPASNLEKIGFVLSIASLICCCCSNIYVTLGASIMALAVSICSRFFGNEEHRFHPIAIAAIVISCISIAIVVFMLFFYLVLYPQLLEDPAYRQMLEQMKQILNGQTDSLFPTESAAPNNVTIPAGNNDTI